MAKRKRLTAPSAEELAQLDEGFAAKPVPDRLGVTAPIAQVAAETARQSSPVAPADRARQAATESDAAAWRKAQAAGLVIREIPLDQIHADHLVRDRVAMDHEALDELKTSIRSGGLRMPIEVVPLPDGFGLISGWRRLSALRALRAEGQGGFDTIRAILRQPQELGQAYAAMVEENEVRLQLTPYERGRIAVVAAAQGAFDSMEQAVDAIYAAASKAKRSKIRSFALVHEELGDLLSFGPDLSEKMGLRLASAIREGFAAKLRTGLAAGQGDSVAEEVALLEVLLTGIEADAAPRRTGRPRQARPRPERFGEVQLANGISIERVWQDGKWSILFHGANVDVEMVEAVMLEIQRLLEPI
ncbi:ParB/RepB/Spo0J family partition protein [Paracoccus jiaweipingae]|uniref:ParB/RepB/Spo0J family partition protein n=1 Tax=unclassified Paracoccus (in: a-proteobacteria) TaxID=2688777 RepID=UPI00378D9AA7